jgi:hypothetical protein
MSDTAAASSKVCTVCGVNVADKPRVKDAAGRYMCKACAEKQTAAKPGTVVRMGSAPAGGATGAPKAGAGGAPAGRASEGVDSVMAALVASSAQATSRACPNCKGWVKDGQLLCTGCGFNLQEGRQARTRVEREKAPKEARVGGAGALGAISPVMWVAVACVCAGIGTAIWYFVA